MKNRLTNFFYFFLRLIRFNHTEKMALRYLRVSFFHLAPLFRTCVERNILAANLRKTTKYTSLKSYIESAGYSCNLIPFEIGSRGHVTRGNRIDIVNTFIQHKINSNALKCIKQLSKISLLCSFSIFHAYNHQAGGSHHS